MNIFENFKNGLDTLENTIKLLNISNTTNNKKNEGVIYTPINVVNYIVNSLDYNPEKTIIEPSVGHGIFIFKLIEYVEKKFYLKGEELKIWFENKVFCFDINKQNINDFKILLTIFFEKRGIINVDYKNIKTEDTLFKSFKHKFDYSFGNPPYIRSKNISPEYLIKLKSKYNSCSSGNIDIYYAFMELMHDISDISSFIVPNAYLINKSAQRIRNKIKDRISEVIDFKTKCIFYNAKTYTSIYKIKKEKSEVINYKEDFNEDWRLIKKSNLENEWHVNHKENNTSNEKIGDIFNVYASIATLRDKSYIVEENNENYDSNYYTKSYKNNNYKIEKSICKKFYKLTKENENLFIIYPYDENVNIISEEDMISQYPEAYKYLTAIKLDLLQRDKGKTEKYESWYSYGRKQGLKKQKYNYFVLLPIMFNENTKSKILKTKEQFLFTSGYAIELKSEDEALKINNMINDQFFKFLKIYGKIWPGKTPYYSFSKSNLENFKIEK